MQETIKGKWASDQVRRADCRNCKGVGTVVMMHRDQASGSEQARAECTSCGRASRWLTAAEWRGLGFHAGQMRAPLPAPTVVASEADLRGRDAVVAQMVAAGFELVTTETVQAGLDGKIGTEDVLDAHTVLFGDGSGSPFTGTLDVPRIDLTIVYQPPDLQAPTLAELMQPRGQELMDRWREAQDKQRADLEAAQKEAQRAARPRPTDLITISEAAELAGVHPNTISTLINLKYLQAWVPKYKGSHQKKGQRLVSRADIIERYRDKMNKRERDRAQSDLALYDNMMSTDPSGASWARYCSAMGLPLSYVPRGMAEGQW